MNALVRTILIGVVLPLAIGLGGVVAILVVLPALPDPVAIHWNAAGEPDGYGPVTISLLFTGLLPVGYAAFVLLAARPRAGEPITFNQRILIATAPFLATVLAVTIAGSTVMQAGLADARDAGDVTGLLVAAFVAGLALSVLGWFVAPRGEVSAEAGEPATAMALGTTERAVWMQRIGPGRGAVVILAVAALLSAGGVVVMWLVAPLPLTIGFTATILLVMLLAAGTLAWRVTVDGDGLRVRSAVGLPRYRVPVADIARVSRIEVDPVRDFGGWGIRWGVVTRRGPAIEVVRRDDSSFVVTVPHAEQGAALLASLQRRG